MTHPRLRRLKLGLLRILEKGRQPISGRQLVVGGFGQVWRFFKRILYYPTVQARKFLQFFLGSVASTRYLMHLFIILATVTVSFTGLVDSGVGHAAQDENRYVTAFGLKAEASEFASLLEGGYLTKGNAVITDFTSAVAEGVQEYVVQPGDTVSTIAARFNTTTKTIEWANQLTNVNTLKPGQVLTVLPTSGVLHEVEEGQTLAALAQKYSISQADLISVNDLVEPVKLVEGQKIVIPLSNDAIPDMPKPVIAASPAPSYGSTPTGSSAISTANVGSVVGGGNFGWPTTGRITKTCAQHGWRDCAIDIASRAYPPVYASDAGVVTVAGWPDNYGYGNRVDINHGNGYVTRYAHLNAIYVSPGQQVSKGQVIGQMGCTGRCSGPHVHFMIIQNGTPRDPMLFL